ncbi:MAG: FkbM family methyltransferase [Coriobacteriales bacterium]|nr:FkbM family methyltransferase [Coriobacteriales bacterium]
MNPSPQPASPTQRAVRAARGALRRLALRVRPSASLSPFERFDRDGHNAMLTRGLPLDPDSVVLDFGGYLGDYTAAIREAYGCTVHVFEPVPEFAESLRQRFADDSRVIVHTFAIGEKAGTRSLGMSDDGTGAFADGAPTAVEFRSVTFLSELLPDGADVAAINIEGGEYELIPALADADYLSRIGRLFIQFHDVDEDSTAQRESCRHLLERTHRQQWNYDWVWEAWVRR